ncbi:hypothetical protein FE257_010597 [Aspergillus nanangensis]|uniref:Uncharacterized protein n=1 Tax=Aspergillus nanangensis TaxID=2582783 RepID=A0AAD4CJU5_ASPNN|nr:hypothetical protein FE257_010597 [Aspergillus nanangensis]
MSTSDMENIPSNSPPPPQQIFSLAHPPPKSPQCLRLTPRLVLQIQQLSSTSGRPIPVLEVFRPSHLGKSIATHGGERGSRAKLSPRDLYILQNEPYTHFASTTTTTTTSTRRASPEIIGAISQSVTKKQNNTPTTTTTILYFPSPPSPTAWKATRLPRGYQFHLIHRIHTRGCSLEWEKRPRSSASEGDDKGDRFVLSIMGDADGTTLRRPWLATLTKRGLKVGGWDRAQREYLAFLTEDDDEDGHGNVNGEEIDKCLCHWALGMAVYVAAQEGWF